MMGSHNIPFTVGEDIEWSSFLAGFRGAWFRCKIKKIGLRNGQLSCALEYYDFPEEKMKWEEIYQSNSADSKRRRKDKKLMMRPPFPPTYHESKKPDVNTISEVVVFVSDVWEVGDLVDWWKDDCYWSGKVAEVLADEKVKVELPLPPVGEGIKGETFEASCKDLRASLNWSLEGGWTVPTSKESKSGRPCARVIKPDNLGDIASFKSVADGRRGVQAVDRVGRHLTRKDIHTAQTNMESDVAGHGFEKMSCSDNASKLQVKDAASKMEATTTMVDMLDNKKPSKQKRSHVVDSGFGKMSCSDRVSKLHVKDPSNILEATEARVDMLDNTTPLKRKKPYEDLVLNSVNSDTLEAALLDLEELLNRIKWMKGMLEIGIPLTGAMRPRWNFIGDQSPSTTM